MGEKPILFNTEMVKAILAGWKTQTRRVIRFPEGTTGRLPEGGNRDYVYYPGGIKHPPYQAGDILWVRETWCRWWLPHGEWSYSYKATSPNGNMAPTSPDPEDEWFVMPWKPSIHMPREAARIFLKVKSVRAGRLQEYFDASCAHAEGVIINRPHSCQEAVDGFIKLWNSTIKPADLPRYGWEANPWVWVIVFERTEKL